MRRREFLQRVGVAAPVAMVGGNAAASAARQPQHPSTADPRVMVYDDGRHGAPLYQFSPPPDPKSFVFSVDQLVSTGVDTLVYMVGLEGGMALYDSRVSQKWGDNIKKWTHPVFYRAARQLRELIANGHDPLKLLCDRCHEKGMFFVAANWLGLQGGSKIPSRGFGRKSDFVYDHPQYEVGDENDPRAQNIDSQRFSWLHEGVREERFRVYEELLVRYETDGVELNLAEFVPLCKFSEGDRVAPLLTNWIHRLREAAERGATAQGIKKRIYVRIPAYPEVWKALGYDVETWARDGLVDGLVCMGGTMESPIDHGPDLSAAVAACEGTNCKTLVGFSDLLGRQFERAATPEMIWGAAANGYAQGADGFAIVEYHFTPNGFPLTEEDVWTLRLLPHPDLLASADKLYRARSVRRGMQNEPDWTIRDKITLPATLNVGQPVSATVRVADDVAAVQADGRLESIHLRVRLTSIEPSLNDVRVTLNGKELPESLLRLEDLTYRLYKLGAINPYGFIYEFALTPEFFPKQGENVVAVTLVKKDPDIDVEMGVYDVDCPIRYRVHRNFNEQPIDY